MAIKISGTTVIGDDFNISNVGSVSASGGFNIGISSAGSVISSGPITTLNFIGAGNTFAQNGSTIDISIAGGGGPGAPVINNVTLSEDVDDTIRFTSKGFTADVDMLSDSPVSQKSIKGTITGNFKVYEESTITNVSNQSINSLPSNEPPQRRGDYSSGLTVTSRKYISITPTSRGGGNGPGYYLTVFGESEGFFSSQNNYNQNVDFYYAKDVTSPAALGNTKTLTGAFSRAGGNPSRTFPLLESWAQRTVIVNDIVWNELNSYRDYGSNINSIEIDQSSRGHCWRDSNGVFADSPTQGGYAWKYWTSDGTVAYQLFWQPNTGAAVNFTRGQLTIGHYYINPSSNNWSLASGGSSIIFAGTTANIPETVGMAYDKPSNKLIVLYSTFGVNTVNIVIFDVNQSELGNNVSNGSTGGRLNTYATNPNGEQFGSASTEKVSHVAYMGDDGTYMTTESDKLYRYDDTQKKFVYVSNLPGNQSGRGLGGDLNGTLYYTFSDVATSIPNDLDIYTSTDNGSTWSLLRTTTMLQSDGQTLSPGIGWSGMTVGIELTATAPMISGALKGSTITVPFNSFLTNLQNGHTVTKKDDEDNVNFIGIVTNKSSNTFKLQSAGTYTTSDELINLDNFTQSSTDRYLVVDGTGSVSALQSTDPGFVQIGPGTSISIDFPAAFTNGKTPDNEIPGSGLLKIEVSATNSQATDTFLSNGVTPT